jgi:hypothetical protein
LLKLHAAIECQLIKLKIIRTANNPTGDLAEYLFCMAFPDWVQEGNSQAHYDAIGPAPDNLNTKVKYQIKGRRLTHNKSRQLSAIRDLKEKHFDFLAGVLFNEDYSVSKAILIPHAVVLKLATPDEHVNGHRFLLRDDVWDDRWKVEGVVDVTAKLQSVWQ